MLSDFHAVCMQYERDNALEENERLKKEVTKARAVARDAERRRLEHSNWSNYLQKEMDAANKRARELLELLGQREKDLADYRQARCRDEQAYVQLRQAHEERGALRKELERADAKLREVREERDCLKSRAASLEAHVKRLEEANPGMAEGDKTYVMTCPANDGVQAIEVTLRRRRATGAA